MNSRYSLSTTTKTPLPDKRFIITIFQRLPQLIIGTSLGLLSGCGSIIIVLATIIIIKAFLLAPEVVFSPHPLWLTLGAILVSLEFSWLLYQATTRILSNLSDNLDAYVMQIIFTAGALSSLLLSLVFLYTP